MPKDWDRALLLVPDMATLIKSGVYLHLNSHNPEHPDRGLQPIGLDLYAATQRFPYKIRWVDDQGNWNNDHFEAIPGAVYLPRVAPMKQAMQKKLAGLTLSELQNQWGARWQNRTLMVTKVYVIESLPATVRMLGSHIHKEYAGIEAKRGGQSFRFEGQIGLLQRLSEQLIVTAATLMQADDFAYNQPAIQLAAQTAATVFLEIERKTTEMIAKARNELLIVQNAVDGVQVAACLLKSADLMRVQARRGAKIARQNVESALEILEFQMSLRSWIGEFCGVLLQAAQDIEGILKGSGGDLIAVLQRVTDYHQWIKAVLLFEPWQSGILAHDAISSLATIKSVGTTQTARDRLLTAWSALEEFDPQRGPQPTSTDLLARQAAMATIKI